MRATVAALLLVAAAAAAVLHASGQDLGQEDLTLTGGASDTDYYVIKRASTVVNEQFSLLQGGPRKGQYAASYAAFMADLDFQVNLTGSRWIQHYPVLGRQQLRRPPATLLNITLTADSDAVSLLVRSDNLYVMGFANKQGIFSFKDDPYTLPGAKPLSFGSGYGDFFPRAGHHGLLNLLVNREQAVKHLRTLSSATATDKGLEVPVAFFVLIVCEAERFTPIREAVLDRWEGAARNIDDVTDHRTNTVLLDLVVKWRVFSCALLSWNRQGESAGAWARSPGVSDIARFGVNTAQGALATINPILQPTSCP